MSETVLCQIGFCISFLSNSLIIATIFFSQKEYLYIQLLFVIQYNKSNLSQDSIGFFGRKIMNPDASERLFSFREKFMNWFSPTLLKANACRSKSLTSGKTLMIFASGDNVLLIVRSVIIYKTSILIVKAPSLLLFLKAIFFLIFCFFPPFFMNSFQFSKWGSSYNEGSLSFAVSGSLFETLGKFAWIVQLFLNIFQTLTFTFVSSIPQLLL